MYVYIYSKQYFSLHYSKDIFRKPMVFTIFHEEKDNDQITGVARNGFPVDVISLVSPAFRVLNRYYGISKILTTTETNK